MKGLVKNEIYRLLISPRWLLVIPAALITAYLGVDVVYWVNFSNLGGPLLNAWDGFMLTFTAGTGTSWAFAYFFIPVFAFIAGNRFIEDRTSGYLSWQLIRAGTKRIWISKILSVLIAAQIYSAVFMVIVAISCMVALPMTLEGSQLSQGAFPLFADFFTDPDLSPEAIAFYKNVSPFLVLLINILFAGLGLGAMISVLLYLTLFIQKPFLPLVLALMLGFLSGLFAFIGKLGLNPYFRLSFDFHGSRNIEPQMILGETIVVWLLLIALAMYFGNKKIRQLLI